MSRIIFAHFYTPMPCQVLADLKGFAMIPKTLLLILLTVGGTGCSALYLYENSSVGRYGTAPPSPSDGYRLRQPDGTLLEYDSARKLYLVVGRPNHYYHDGSYYRRAQGQWQTTETVSGDWRVVSINKLPSGLRL